MSDGSGTAFTTLWNSFWLVNYYMKFKDCFPLLAGFFKWYWQTVTGLWWFIKNDVNIVLIIFWAGTWEDDNDAVVVDTITKLCKVVDVDTELWWSRATLSLIVSRFFSCIEWFSKSLLHCWRRKTKISDIRSFFRQPQMPWESKPIFICLWAHAFQNHTKPIFHHFPPL